MEGLTTPKIEGKFSLRASVTGQIAMDDVRIPAGNLLPKIDGLGVGGMGKRGEGDSSKTMLGMSICPEVMNILFLLMPHFLTSFTPRVPLVV